MFSPNIVQFDPLNSENEWPLWRPLKRAYKTYIIVINQPCITRFCSNLVCWSVNGSQRRLHAETGTGSRNEPTAMFNFASGAYFVHRWRYLYQMLCVGI